MGRTEQGIERRRGQDLTRYYAKKAADPDLLRKKWAKTRASETPEQRAKRLAYVRAWQDRHPDYQKEWGKAHPGYFAARERAKRAADPEGARLRARNWRLKSKYGITGDEYDAMAAAQAGVCAICGRAETMRIKGTLCILAVDHDAETGRVRGLLCVNCNMLIGGARHDPAILREAIAYLER